MGSEVGPINESLSSRYSEWIHEALDELTDNFLITDPTISGHPIAFASRGFLKMCGYSREEVLGRNGRIFQGPGTDRRSVLEIREAIRQEKALQISLLNYKKDGTPYWVLFHLSPVFSREDGRVVHFVAAEEPISTNSRVLGDSSIMRDIVFGSCRKEVGLDSFGEFSRALRFNSHVDLDNRGLVAGELCEASDAEKQKAAAAINNILSKLTHYSELSGKAVCGKRCGSVGIVPLSSSLIISLGRIKQSFVLTDPYLPDMPIVYASDAFIKLTGYSRHEVLGQNCRFLQGPNTDVEAVCQIREGIKTAQPCTVHILNYRKDGSSFWNFLHTSPVRSASGKIAFYVGVQMDEGSKHDERGLSPEKRQLGAIGAVKVAVRSLLISVSSSKT